MARIFGVFTIVLFLTLAIYSASKKKFEVLLNKCVGCAECIDVCPTDAITLKRGKAVIDPEKCTGCNQCIYICSFYAIRAYGSSEKIARAGKTKVKKREGRKKSSKQTLKGYSIVDELEKLVKLRKDGIITEEEFIMLKKRLLSQ